MVRLQCNAEADASTDRRPAGGVRIFETYDILGVM